MNRKFLIPFIIFSLVIHAILIAVLLRVHFPGITTASKVISVEIKSSKDVEEPYRKKIVRPLLPQVKEIPKTDPPREASVDLGKPGGAYEAYLDQIRGKIELYWAYPPRALAERVEGNAVIRFSINARGVLADYAVVSSSGSVLLDEGALDSIRDAAPFGPMPADYNLSFLHFTASFSYKINL